MKPIELVDRLGRWSAGRGPLYVLLAARLRRLIDDGELPPGTLLPPDRALARGLAVGRTTVVAAYDLLRAEARIARRQGSGTRVAGAAVPDKSAVNSGAGAFATTADHAESGAETLAGTQTGTQAGSVALSPVDPIFLHSLESRDDGVMLVICAAPDAPPPELVAAYTNMIPALMRIRSDIGYYPYGHPTLRQAIAARYSDRGVPTSPDEVLVTNGGQQALSLLARTFLRPGDQVLVEAPTYPGALEAFREEAAIPVGLPVGLAGFEAVVRDRKPALAYVIPTYHNPTGSVLPALVRHRLALAAAAADVPLIEDEVPADLHFLPGQHFSAPPTPISAFHDAVISVGSLSKSVWGGLRIGWIRASAPIATRIARLRAVHDLGGDVPAQLAAADLITRWDGARLDSGALGSQLRTNHDHLVAELAANIPSWEIPEISGGHTLWIRLPYGDGASFAQAALRQRIAVLPGAGLDVTGNSDSFLRLHFRATPAELTEAVRRLAAAWRSYRPPIDSPTTPPTLAI